MEIHGNVQSAVVANFVHTLVAGGGVTDGAGLDALKSALRRAFLQDASQIEFRSEKTVVAIDSAGAVFLSEMRLRDEDLAALQQAVAAVKHDIESERYAASLRSYFAALRRLNEHPAYDTLSSRLGRNQSATYVPLTLEKPDRPGLRLDTVELLASIGREDGPRSVVISGPAGSGKSSLLRHIGAQVVLQATAGNSALRFIPLYVRLPLLANATGVVVERRLWEATCQAGDLAMQGEEPPAGFMSRWAELLDAKWLLLLDGHDEVPPAQQLRLGRWLSDLLCNAPCCILVTSRWFEADIGFQVDARWAVSSLARDSRDFILRATAADRWPELERTLNEQRLSHDVLNRPLGATLVGLAFRHLGEVPKSLPKLLQSFLDAVTKEAAASNSVVPVIDGKPVLEVVEAVAWADLLRAAKGKELTSQAALEDAHLDAVDQGALLEALAPLGIVRGLGGSLIWLHSSIRSLLAARHAVRRFGTDALAEGRLLQCKGSPIGREAFAWVMCVLSDPRAFGVPAPQATFDSGAAMMALAEGNSPTAARGGDQRLLGFLDKSHPLDEEGAAIVATAWMNGVEPASPWAELLAQRILPLANEAAGKVGYCFAIQNPRTSFLEVFASLLRHPASARYFSTLRAGFAEALLSKSKASSISDITAKLVALRNSHQWEAICSFAGRGDVPFSFGLNWLQEIPAGSTSNSIRDVLRESIAPALQRWDASARKNNTFAADRLYLDSISTGEPAVDWAAANDEFMYESREVRIARQAANLAACLLKHDGLNDLWKLVNDRASSALLKAVLGASAIIAEGDGENIGELIALISADPLAGRMLLARMHERVQQWPTMANAVREAIPSLLEEVDRCDLAWLRDLSSDPGATDQLAFEAAIAAKSIDDEALSDVVNSAKRLLVRTPDDLKVKCELGKAFYFLDRNQEALAELDACVNADSTAQHLFWRGLIRRDIDDISGSADDLARAAALAPQDERTQREFGVSLYFADRYKEALPILINAHGLDANNGRTCKFLAYVSSAVEGDKKAAAWFDKATDLGGLDTSFSLWSRAKNCNAVLRPNCALMALEKLRQSSSAEDFEARERAMFVMCQVDLEKFEEARRILEEGEAFDGDDEARGLVFFAKAELALALGQPDPGAHLLKFSQEDYPFAHNLGNALRTLGVDETLALKFLFAAADICECKPDGSTTASELGDLLYGFLCLALGRSDGALAVGEMLISKLETQEQVLIAARKVDLYLLATNRVDLRGAISARFVAAFADLLPWPEDVHRGSRWYPDEGLICRMSGIQGYSAEIHLLATLLAFVGTKERVGLVWEVEEPGFFLIAFNFKEEVDDPGKLKFLLPLRTPRDIACLEGLLKQYRISVLYDIHHRDAVERAPHLGTFRNRHTLHHLLSQHLQTRAPLL